MMKPFQTRCLLLAFVLALSPSLSRASDNCPERPPPEAPARATTLRAELRHHDELYYQSLKPEISDAQYDSLFTELVRLEQCFPALATADSPTGRVGSGSPSASLKLHHERPMLSLASSIGPEAVEALLHKGAAETTPPRLLVQPKVDGLPVELIYQSGRLVSAATRGNGQYGDEVTSRIREVPGIPQQLSGGYPELVVVRGEIYADLALMAAASAAGETYATPRHYAAGTLKALDPAPLALAALRIFPFELVDADEHAGVTTDAAALGKLAEWGFQMEPGLTWRAETLDQVRSLYEKYLARRGAYPFAADGIVVKFDDLALRRRLGEGTRAPFWAAA